MKIHALSHTPALHMFWPIAMIKQRLPCVRDNLLFLPTLVTQNNFTVVLKALLHITSFMLAIPLT